jgi:hypothetical protein
MKKVILLIAVFTMAIGFSSEAQISQSEVLQSEQLDDRRIEKDEKASKRNQKVRVKAKKRAHKKHLKSMRNVANADGIVTPVEQATFKAEKRKMRDNAKRKAKCKHKKHALKKRAPLKATEY